MKHLLDIIRGFCRRKGAILRLFPAALICSTGLAATAAPTAAVPVVCVSSFEAAAGDPALEGISAAVSDLLQASLARRQEVKVVDRDHLTQLMREQEVTVRGLSEPATAVRLGHLLGADRFITGSAMLANRELTIVANVLDVGTATVLAGKKVSGPPEKLADLTVELAGQLAQVLNLKPPSAQEYEEQPIGSLHFLRGLGFYHSGNYDRALAEFMLCGDIAPDHPGYRHWMGLCYYQLNEFDHARIEFRRFLRDQPASDKAVEAAQLLKECEAKRKEKPPLLLLPPGSGKP